MSMLSVRPDLAAFLHAALGEQRRRQHPAEENDWSQVNEGRYNNPITTALYDEASGKLIPTEAAELFIR